MQFILMTLTACLEAEEFLQISFPRQDSTKRTEGSHRLSSSSFNEIPPHFIREMPPIVYDDVNVNVLPINLMRFPLKILAKSSLTILMIATFNKLHYTFNTKGACLRHFNNFQFTSSSYL